MGVFFCWLCVLINHTEKYILFCNGVTRANELVTVREVLTGGVVFFLTGLKWPCLLLQEKLQSKDLGCFTTSFRSLREL